MNITIDLNQGSSLALAVKDHDLVECLLRRPASDSEATGFAIDNVRSFLFYRTLSEMKLRKDKIGTIVKDEEGDTIDGGHHESLHTAVMIRNAG